MTSSPRVVAILPMPADRHLLKESLGDSDVSIHHCESFEDWQNEVSKDTAIGVLAAEALTRIQIASLHTVSLPLILLVPSDFSEQDKSLEALILLEKPVSQRTFSSVLRIALAQAETKRRVEEISRSEQTLKRSNDDLQRMVYAAGHDLQEPLRMVSSYLQLLERKYVGKLDSDADEFIGMAVDGATRMTRLISDLLSFSRLDNVARNPREVSCADAIVWIRMSLQKPLEESGATLTHDDLPVVIFDQNQLIQVFQYLIGNAIQYRSKEPLKIHISATRHGAEWIFAIEDNGLGFENRYAEQIFGAFKRLHGREYPGTGLGLAFCRRILDYHGGRIWAESEPGKGSTFYFSARAVEAAVAAQ